ncbi:MAG: TIGR03086 family metal-binding protein, partial [Actinomycetota bacterium]|nr:TIGR03086 family metal-binding protein [Actinomycetota bacterium]
APGWAARIPRTVETLVRAWHRPEAWTGQTRAGGVDLPGEVAGLVALNEVVLHGWDLARATGQGYDIDDATATAVLGFVSQIGDHEREAMFGPALPAPDDADALDHALALSGRDPRWEPSG